MRVVIIDAFDSFVYIIMQYIGELGLTPTVLRSHDDNCRKIVELQPDAIILGPGPGHPNDSGHLQIIQEFQGKIPILGVCLGHQAIGLYYGGNIGTASHIMHGKNSKIVHDGLGMFSMSAQETVVTRYHSLIVHDEALPECLIVSARSHDDQYIMGLRHTQYPIESVQFHPESVGTVDGKNFFSSFFSTYCSRPVLS